MKLSDYVIQFISKLGVGHVFYLPGGGAMHLVDSLGNAADFEIVCCLHEQAVAIAAQSYSMHTNNFGVGVVTTGPGGTNAITGVSAAWIDSVPCLFVSGQVKRSDMMYPSCECIFHAPCKAGTGEARRGQQKSRRPHTRAAALVEIHHVNSGCGAATAPRRMRAGW